ncbi:hypothetical protein PG911_03930 [Tenacibaculum ovolyticum]|uniref:hypothetical protein n=1 Tax=Tenacibaculum ovolyticum TaxID=104270 RepID=UPI0022F3B5CA|nr:hypothetical protein [Tenacibaculum ovolyticum]WBX77422.1 hypothetical protein PG911_03930 [Tenacibaculum ovolyticum]
MKKTIIITFIWIGFVGAISFMESWLKFQAPGITTKLGLGIGRLVFNALNIMEIVFSITIIASLVMPLRKQKLQFSYTFLTVIFIVILQTFWLLPILNEQAELIIQGIEVKKGNFHFVFVLLEVIKMICLFFFGFNQLKKITNKIE